MKTKPAWLAVIVATVGVLVPGLLLGAIGSYVYRFFVYREVGAEPDFFMMRWLFGFSAPGDLVKWLFYEGFPSAVHGGIAGAVGLALANWFCRNPNIMTVAWTTGALFTGAALMIGGFGLLVVGPNSNFFALVFQVVGLWIGLLAVAENGPSAPSPQPSTST